MSQPKLRINIGNDNLKSSEISQSSNKSVKSSKYHSTDRATKYKDIKRNKMINYHPMKNKSLVKVLICLNNPSIYRLTMITIK